MPNYQDGKIYTIRNYTDNEMIYVGSTTETLSRRLAKHRYDCKRGLGISLYSHITNNDWSNWYIELYEYYPCNERAELDRREGEVIREIGTINKRIAGRTKEEWCEENPEYFKEYNENNADKFKEYQKTYYEDNKDKVKEKVKNYQKNNADIIKEKNKKWCEDNAEKIKEKNKKYREGNADKIKEKNKKYREGNADKIKENKKKYYEKNADIIKEKICCDICGAFVRTDSIRRHQKSKKCTDIASKK